jgi:hypothetical protein
MERGEAVLLFPTPPSIEPEGRKKQNKSAAALFFWSYFPFYHSQELASPKYHLKAGLLLYAIIIA